MAQVKGIAVISRLRFVRERFGEEGVSRLRRALEPADRALLDAHVLPHAWVPFSLYANVNVVADRLFGDGNLQLCVEMGRYGASLSLPTVFKLFVRLGSPTFILGKATRLWSAHYDSGSLVTHEDGAGRVRLEIRDFETPHRAHCLSVLGWAIESIALSGAHPQEANEVRCRTWGHPHCELALSRREEALQVPPPRADAELRRSS